MLNLKKTAVAVLALGSSAAFAGTMGPVCAPGNVTVPCESTAWDFGAQALYLQPSYNDAGGNYIGFTENADGNANGSLIDGQPTWGWGFMIEASYHFGTGNDINVNWYHLDDNSELLNFASDVTVFGTFPARNQGETQSYSIDPKWDAVNIEFGQHVDYGMMSNVRYHAGVQFANIRTNEVYRTSSPTDTGLNYQEAANASYNGFGPRVGADASYDFGNGLGIYAKTAATLLAGTSKINASIDSSTPTSDFPGVSRGVSGSTTAIVPELEGKLGARYTYAMPQGDVTFDVGYMWINYFNAQTSLIGATNDDSDFGLQGLYFGLKWVGSVV